MVSHVVLHLNYKSSHIESDGTNTEMDKSSSDENTLTVHCASNASSNTLSQSIILTTITVHIHDVQQYDPLSLASLMPILRKDGQGIVHLHYHTGVKDDTTTSTKAQTSMILAGLTPESELRESNECRIFTARLKRKKNNGGRKIGSLGRLNRINNISTASKAKFNLRPATVQAVVKINIQNATMLLSSEDGKQEGSFDDYDSGLIDEDDLLDFESTRLELAPPPIIDLAERSKAAYNNGGGRKACDNCSCGRKELEELEASAVISSACGNCSKGDAFRCAGCPYLGKPAFKDGEEHLVLDLTDDF